LDCNSFIGLRFKIKKYRKKEEQGYEYYECPRCDEITDKDAECCQICGCVILGYIKISRVK